MTADEAFCKLNEPRGKTTPTSLAAYGSIYLCLLLSHWMMKTLFTIIDLQLCVSQQVSPSRWLLQLSWLWVSLQGFWVDPRAATACSFWWGTMSPWDKVHLLSYQNTTYSPTVFNTPNFKWKVKVCCGDIPYQVLEAVKALVTSVD